MLIPKLLPHLNTASFRIKFILAEEIIQILDIFHLSKAVLDNAFPSNLFKINMHKIYRYNRHIFGGGLTWYINEQLPCK